MDAVEERDRIVDGIFQDLGVAQARVVLLEEMELIDRRLGRLGVEGPAEPTPAEELAGCLRTFLIERKAEIVQKLTGLADLSAFDLDDKSTVVAFL